MTSVESAATLPEAVRRCLWDVDLGTFASAKWRDFVIGRVLGSGDWPAVLWLRSDVTAHELARWLLTHRGRGVLPQRLRYWQLMLSLPAGDVDAWIAKAKGESWGARCSP